MLPGSASTCPETKLKAPARTAGEQGPRSASAPGAFCRSIMASASFVFDVPLGFLVGRTARARGRHRLAVDPVVHIAGKVALPDTARAVRVDLSSQPLSPGPYTIRAAVSSRGKSASDSLRIVVPAGEGSLGRNGRPLAVPVTIDDRDENGTRYVTGEIVLAPLAVGDYLVEFAAGAARAGPGVPVAFRIVP
jgi:hypothetical protein